MTGLPPPLDAMGQAGASTRHVQQLQHSEVEANTGLVGTHALVLHACGHGTPQGWCGA